MALDPIEGRKVRRYSRGLSRGFRRASLAILRSGADFFRLDHRLRGGIRMRLLDLEIEKAHRDLGEFLYAHLQPEPLDEGDLVLLDLMRNEILRLEEERRLAESKARGGENRALKGKGEV
ncbi:MAG: hypothetical protein ACP5OP_00120 [Leptospirillia bacterium]